MLWPKAQIRACLPYFGDQRSAEKLLLVQYMLFSAFMEIAARKFHFRKYIKSSDISIRSESEDDTL